MEDTKIIELYLRRDQQAIAETDRSYGGRLQALSERIVQSFEDAQECVSDTYLKTWETIPPQRPRFFYAYLSKLCRHFSLGRLDWNNAAKRKAEVVALTQEMENCIPDQCQAGQEDRRELVRILNAFLEDQPAENRVIFLRRYWYCETVTDIARHCGLRENAVHTRLHRLRTKLREHLAKEGICV